MIFNISKTFRIVFTVLAVAVVIAVGRNTTDASSLDDSNMSALAEANGLVSLQPGNIAVIGASDSPGSSQHVWPFMMRDGSIRSIQASELGMMMAVGSHDSGTTFVPGNSATTLLKTDFSDGMSAKDLDQFQNPTEYNSLRPMIVEFVDSYRPVYGSSLTPSKVTETFDDIKQRVEREVGSGNGYIGTELRKNNAVAVVADDSTLRALARKPFVKRIVDDRPVRVQLNQSVLQIQADDVWGYKDRQGAGITGVGVTIAIIDTGVAYTHADLGGCLGASCKVIGGYDFVNADSNPMDDHGHGTHVASIAAGQGSLPGVAPGARLLAYKVLNQSGSGYTSTVAAAIDRATDPNNDGNTSDRVDVINLSVGAPGDPDDFLSQAVDRATAAGSVVVVAAGNDGPDPETITSPGVARTAVTVAASCKTSQINGQGTCATAIANFSSRGPVVWDGGTIQKPDIAAPGVLICAAKYNGGATANYSTCVDTSHTQMSGTSMAAPHVAGLAALVRQGYPSLTPAQIKEKIIQTGRPLQTTVNDEGQGEVDATQAVAMPGYLNISSTFWDVRPQPSQSNPSYVQAFTVASYDSSITTLSVQSALTAPGITLSTNVGTLNVAQPRVETINGIVNVDIAQAVVGTYFGRIQFFASGVLKGYIVVRVTVQPNFSLSIQDDLTFALGDDNPTIQTWSPAARIINVSNLRNDAAATITTTVSGLPVGVNVLINPLPLVLPAGGNGQISVTFQVDNTVVPNGLYLGTITFSAAGTSTIYEVSFSKYYRLTVRKAPGQYGGYIQIHDGADVFITDFFPEEKTYYLMTDNPVDVIGSYVRRSANSQTRWDMLYAFYEQLPFVNGVQEVLVDMNQAVHRVSFDATTIDGERPVFKSALMRFTYTPTNTILSAASFLILTDNDFIGDQYYSDVSQRYKIHRISAWPVTIGRNLHYLYHEVHGISGDQVKVVRPGDFTTTYWQLDTNQLAGSITPLVWPCIKVDEWGAACSAGRFGEAVELPVTQRVSTNIPPGLGLYFSQISDWNEHTCPSGSCPYYRKSSLVDISSRARKSTFWTSNILEPYAGNQMYTGLGPVAWMAFFQNNANNIYLKTNDLFNELGTALMTQDYSFISHGELPYSLKQGGTTIRTGTFPGFFPNISYLYAPKATLASIGQLAGGTYQWIQDIPYSHYGTNLTARVEATMTTTAVDPNPPRIQLLNTFSGAQRSAVYDMVHGASIVGMFDAVGGTISSVVFEASTNGTNFVPVNVENISGRYTASIPAGLSGDVISIRFTATDSTGNALKYTFQMPAGVAPEPQDVTAPAHLTDLTVSGF